jgi:hypothetical protein
MRSLALSFFTPFTWKISNSFLKNSTENFNFIQLLIRHRKEEAVQGRDN